MFTKKKKVTVSVGPSVFLLVFLVVAGILLYRRFGQREGGKLAIDETASIVTRVRTLGELTTACFYDEIVLSESKENIFSVSPLGTIAKESFGQDVDDHLVIIARGTVRAGIDLRKLSEENIRIVADTVILHLPEPEYLDVIVNPTNFEVFAESGNWPHEEVSQLQNTARQRLLQEADQAGLKALAAKRAEDAISKLLLTCSYKLIRFESTPPSLRAPGRE